MLLFSHQVVNQAWNKTLVPNQEKEYIKADIVTLLI